MELNVLLSSEAALPSTPKVVALLLSELGRDQPDLRKISQLFSADPGLATRLMQLANGSRTAFAQSITSIAEALAVLDLSELRPLAAAAAVGGSFRNVAGIQLQQFWRYSLNVAKLSRSLAASVRQKQATAYTAGLVHAIGELAMLAGMPDEMASLNMMAGPFDLRRARMEQRTFGYSYADVSAGLARRWQLPELIIDALLHQAAPFENDVYEPLAGVVHLSSWRARAREAELDDKALAVSFPDQVGLALGLDIDMVLQQDPIDWTARSDLGAFV